MIYLKTDEEIELMRESNRLVGMTHGELSKQIRPGIPTLQLDKIADEFIRDHGAVPSFLGYGGFPNSICTSVNEHVVHGIPNNTPLQEGDIISVDCGTLKNGFNGDSVVRELVGHGIGRKMHESPEVPNYGRRGTGPLIKNGMCIAIEPMINMGSKNVVFESDGWTVRTKDLKPSAHFEHTIAVRNGKADILSTFEFIKDNL